MKHRVLGAACALILPLSTAAAAAPEADNAPPATKESSRPAAALFGVPVSRPITFRVRGAGARFTTTLPADSVSTFRWKDGERPKQWMTTATSLGNKLTRRVKPMEVTASSAPTRTVWIDRSRRFQTIGGFGTALPDSAAKLIGQSPNRQQMLRRLFGRAPGQAGLSIARVPIGSTDLMSSAHDVHTLEDSRGSFDLNKDWRVLKLAAQARQVGGPGLKIFAAPWSAPGWMKTGGKLLPDACWQGLNSIAPEHNEDYARYLARYAWSMKRRGMKPAAISLMNEPRNCKTEMPTTVLDADQAATISRLLRPKLPKGVQILGWDHNWDDPGYVGSLIEEGRVRPVGYHCYGGTDYAAQPRQMPVIMTECSGFTSESTWIPQDLGWETAHAIMGPMRYGSKGALYWSAAQRPDGRPYLAGSDSCKRCRGMLQVRADGSFTTGPDFAFWRQFSSFVRPGAVRVHSSQGGDLSTVAFKQGDTNVLVALNSNWAQADGG